MRNLPLVSRLWVPLAIVLLALPLAAQERVAQVSEVDGDVQVTRQADGSTESITQMGTRVRGGSLYSGDEIRTGPGSTARVVFSDGTLVDLSQETVVAVEQADRSREAARGEVERPIGRTIRLVAGDIFSDIAHNPQVATEFATPSGVASVKGTKIRLSVEPTEEKEAPTR